MKRFKIHYILLLISLITLISCEDQEKEIQTNSSTVGGNQNKTPPGRWPDSDLPVSIVISEDFDQDELLQIETMGDSWSDVVNDEAVFLSFNSAPVGNLDLQDLDDYYDNQQGIYRSYKWHSELSSTTLAITQFFGYRKSSIFIGEYIELDHADIILNYKHHVFNLEPSFGEYDLPSVVLHELGHFIGLNHQSWGAKSVMVPNLSSAKKIRAPFALDKSALEGIYQLGSSSIAALQSQNFVLENPNSSEDLSDDELVKGIIELKANGDCLHYIDNELIYSH